MKPDLKKLQDALDADPDHWEARRKLAEIFFDEDDFESAAALIEEAPSLPEDEEEFYEAARLAAPARPDHAQLILTTLLQLNPGSIAAHTLQAEIHEAQGRTEAAARHREVAGALSGKSPEKGERPVEARDAQDTEDAESDTGDKDDEKDKDEDSDEADEEEEEVDELLGTRLTSAPAPAIAALERDPLYDPLEEEEGVLTAAMLSELNQEESRIMKREASRAKVSSLFISLAAHAAILLVLGIIIIAVPRQAPPVIVAVAERAQPAIPDPKKEKTRPTYSANTQPSSKVVPVLTSVNFSSLAVPVMEEVPVDVLAPGLSMEDGPGMTISFSGAGDGWVASLPASLQSRCSLVERMSRLKVGGGSKRCETAVEKALGWLSETQNSDGSWGKKYPVAMTGLSLLTFLGRCETPDSPVYAETVINASTYLMDKALQNGGKMMSPGGKLAYEHGIATYALCELFTLSRRGKHQIPELRGVIDKAVPIIISGQNPNGSWLYAYEKGRSDTSVSGWQIQALKAAKNTGIEMPGLDESFEKSMSFLLSMQGPKGGFGYTEARREDRPSLSGVGVLGLQFGDRGGTDEVKKGLEYILGSHKSMSYRNINFYDWYYSTQACFQEGGE
ncbi:MAG: hypothetical protein ACYTFG_21520, partial [Planctomycetota bacterium]